MVSFDGGSASKVDDVTALPSPSPSRQKMADMCYYGNVMTTTRWWQCVTMETLFYIFNSTVIDWTCFYFKVFYVGLSLTSYRLGAALELLKLEISKENMPLTNNSLIFTFIYERLHYPSFSYWDELLKTLKTTPTYAVVFHAWCCSFLQGRNFLKV